MKKRLNTTIACAAALAVTVFAANDMIWLRLSNGVRQGVAVSEMSTIGYDADGNLEVKTTTGETYTVAPADVDKVSFSEPESSVINDAVVVNFGSENIVNNPFFFEGVDVTATGEHVVINSTMEETITLRISGKTKAGQVKVYAEGPVNVILNNAEITNDDGSALNFQGTAPVTLNVLGVNTLSDSKKYNSTPEGESESATIHSNSKLTINGNGTLNLTSLKKHGINSEEEVVVNSGNINVLSAKSDGIHGEGVTINGGTFTTQSTTGDGIDAGKGDIFINGGVLDITNSSAEASKSITTKGNMTITAGTITTTLTGATVVDEAKLDVSYCSGIKVKNDFTMEGGSYTATGTQSGNKGISVDGTATFNGGEITISVAGDTEEYTFNDEVDTYSSSAISVDTDLIVNGGKFVLEANGSASKAFKCDGNAIFGKEGAAGPNIRITLNGATKITNGNPSYCSGVKVDGNFTMNSGILNVTGTKGGNKGVSVDGICTFNDCDVTMNLSGDGVVYKNTAGNYDTATTSGVTVDEALYVYGGKFVINNSGSAGKGYKCDKTAVFGETGANGPDITITMTGQRVQESAANAVMRAPGGWNPGGGPGGGFDQNGDYANPKAIKIDGNLTMNSGNYVLKCTNNGGEAIESKATLTINGGTYDLNTVDDAINAATHIQINGGAIRAIASGNDGIDSNGTITITGGIVIAAGAASPECGFDCDNNKFRIQGGYVFGMGGSTSTPTADPQRFYSGTKAVTANQTLTVVDKNGKQVMSVVVPKTLSNARLIISAPEFTTGSGTYSIYTNGTVTGGTTVLGVTTGASFSGGSGATTFTL